MGQRNFSRIICVLIVVTCLSACSAASGPLTLSEQLETLEEDLRALFETKEVEKPITLYQAMARALKYNMDHRLAVAEESVANGNVALARLGMLPSLEMKGQYIGRNNQSASSSQSYVTGTQSLESSISTEKHRRTGSLEASWDILDTGLAFVESRQETDRARIAAERRRKVIHNIVQDVRYAYWQAAGAQEMLAKIDSLTNKGNAIIENIRKAEDAGVKSPEESLKTQSRLLGTMDELMTMRSQLSFARIELASLMNVPPAAAFTLATDAKDLPFKKTAIPGLDVPVRDLEKLALVIRPEIREEFFQKRIAANDISLAVLETFPGMDILLSQNYDDNKFLAHDKWASFSLGFTQSLIRLFTLPARLEQARTKQKLADLKRQALAVAIIAQVHVADARFGLSRDRLKLLRRIHAVNEKMATVARSQKVAETLTEGELLEVEMGLLLSRIRTYLAFAEMQNAYGQVINSLGLDLLPEEALEKETDELAGLLQGSLSRLDKNSLTDIISHIKEKRKDRGMDVMEAATETEVKNAVQKNGVENPAPEAARTASIPLPPRKPDMAHLARTQPKRKQRDTSFMSFKGLYQEASLQ